MVAEVVPRVAAAAVGVQLANVEGEEFGSVPAFVHVELGAEAVGEAAVEKDVVDESAVGGIAVHETEVDGAAGGVAEKQAIAEEAVGDAHEAVVGSVEDALAEDEPAGDPTVGDGVAAGDGAAETEVAEDKLVEEMVAAVDWAGAGEEQAVGGVAEDGAVGSAVEPWDDELAAV